MDTSSQRLRFVSELAQQVSQGATFGSLVRFLFSALKSLGPCDRLSIWFVHEDSESLILGPVFPQRKTLISTGYREDLGEGAGAAGKKVIVVDDLRRIRVKKSARLLLQEGFKSGVSAPIRTHDRLLGILWLHARSRNVYTRGQEPFLQLVAAQLAISLERARMVSRRTIDRGAQERLLDENARLREALAPELASLIGGSAPWRKLLKKIEMVANTGATVLIRGETGTGKELIARAIHRLSARKDKPFVAINCGALSRELIASELFGHERGAFTGAVQRKLGRIELAQGGTLFLDEIAELSGDLQVKLLRVLQEREFERVGGTQTLRADVRVIAATHRNLETERAELRFRDDLYFRLNVIPIHVPPLRERKEDVELLLNYFLARFSQKMNKPFDAIDPQSIEQCILYHWPGNVRELENVVERSVILSSGPELHLAPLAEAEQLAEEPGSSLELDDVIARHLTKVLRMTRGKIYGQDGAASVLGLKPSTLQAKMRKHGVQRTNQGD